MAVAQQWQLGYRIHIHIVPRHTFSVVRMCACCFFNFYRSCSCRTSMLSQDMIIHTRYDTGRAHTHTTSIETHSRTPCPPLCIASLMGDVRRRSGCMAYFFGFFGISFLDTNAMERSPSSFGLSHLDGHLYASSNQRQGAGFAGASGKGGETPPRGLNHRIYATAISAASSGGQQHSVI